MTSVVANRLRPRAGLGVDRSWRLLLVGPLAGAALVSCSPDTLVPHEHEWRLEVAQAEIAVTDGAMRMSLDPDAAYTLKELTLDGQALITNTGYNGSVYNLDGQWIGSGHGGETAEITWDEREDPPLIKSSDLGDVFHQARYCMREDLIVVQHEYIPPYHMEGLDVSLVSRFYAYMFCHPNDMTEFLGPDGQVLSADLDNMALHNLSAPSVTVTTKDGSRGVTYEVLDGDLTGMVWDRDVDNKLYLVADPERLGKCLLKASYTISIRPWVR